MDNRTKRQKLEAMANQTESPEEARIAREKLKELGPDPEPLTQVVKNVSTWIDYDRDVIITEITFADGRKDRKEISLKPTIFYGTYSATQSFTASNIRVDFGTQKGSK